MNITILSDNPIRYSNTINPYIAGQYGGSEHEVNAIIDHLEKLNHQVQLIKSDTETKHLNKYNKIIFFNFMRRSQYEINNLINSGIEYSIVENDFKCFPGRIVENHYMKDGICTNILFKSFYENAKNVFTVSTKQYEILKKNLPEKTNLINLGISCWSDVELDYIEKVSNNILPYKKLYEDICLLHGSEIPTKGIQEGLSFIFSKNKIPAIIPSMPKDRFINSLAKGETFVFLPQITESYSRVTVEAKMLHNNIVVNDKVPSAIEDYVKENSGLDLINQVRNKTRETIKTILNHI